ncbi:FecR domain-containing protein [Haloferula sp. A504]|uniref:FecR domain-containing protein n=1 Tax=Haloferula sp. A504 TaxID=3373601 RepID=UPI0031CC281A|nr:FecR domain-containing protein [Verrucomicrobiaceae bacterium E54]
MSQNEVEARIQHLIDGKLDPDARVTLLAEIERDPQLLEIYWDYVVLDSAFKRLSRSAASLQVESPLLSERDLGRRQKRQLHLSLLATAALLVLAAVLLRLILVPSSNPGVALRSSPGSVLEISHSVAEDKQPPPETLVPGSRARLEQGTVELTFENGVQSIVRGPADLTLHADGNLYLQAGTAWFNVPEKAVGFTVKTADMVVTDLGTTFGVRSQEGFPHEVHVFGGRVEASPRGPASATETLNAGAARAVGLGGRLREIPLDPNQFLTNLPKTSPHLHWSFDDGEAFSDSQGEHPAAGNEVSALKGLGNTKAFRRTGGRFGQALATTGKVAQAPSGWSGVLGDAPRTIAHWIKLGSGEREASHVLVGWGSHTLTPFNPNPAFLTFLRRVDEGTVPGVSFGSYYLIGTTPIDDDRWHHFAVVYTGRQLPDGTPDLTCYLDGRPETMISKVNLSSISPDEQGAFTIQTTKSAPGAINLTLLPNNWVRTRSSQMALAIDELFVFESSLSAAEVHQLYQHNSLSQTDKSNP